MVTLDALQALAGEGEAALDAMLLPVEAGLAGFPPVDVDEEGARRLAQGQALREEALAGRGETVALFDGTGRALGVGRRDPDGLRPQRLFRWAAALGQPGAA
jgi:tRNA pseudouridine55 synthase